MSKLKEKKKSFQKKEDKGFDLTYVFLGIGAIVILGFIYLVFFVNPGSTISDTELLDDDPFKGPSDAKVTIVEFSDFECPACGAAYPVLKQLFEEYSDKVKFVYRDFPLTTIPPFALKAAYASQCAFEQGKFWEYHDKLFENQEKLAVSDLKQYAIDVGLNSAQFDSCLDTSKYSSEVAKDQSYGISIGVNGTPTFFINKVKYSNLSLEQFKQIIDAKLAK